MGGFDYVSLRNLNHACVARPKIDEEMSRWLSTRRTTRGGIGPSSSSLRLGHGHLYRRSLHELFRHEDVVMLLVFLLLYVPAVLIESLDGFGDQAGFLAPLRDVQRDRSNADERSVSLDRGANVALKTLPRVATIDLGKHFDLERRAETERRCGHFVFLSL